MKNKIVDMISMGLGLTIFILLIKYFYFDTNLGFDIHILHLSYSNLPMFIDVIIFVLFFPFLCYKTIEYLLDTIIDNLILTYKMRG